MSPRTKRYKNHYGFKCEAEFLAYCREQAAAGKTVTATELKMLVDINTELGGLLNTFKAAQIKRCELDTSDIPEATEEWFAKAKLKLPKENKNAKDTDV